MSSRFPPSSGFNPRDRSPQRFGDRRPPVGPRGSDDGPPPYLAREPPRGPKALIDPPRGAPFGGRGRGYPRGDFRERDRDIRGRDRDRDRDFRDHRDFRDGPPPFRRDIDRDRARRDRDFEPRDSRFGFRRGRSRSPPPIPRDFRDAREPVGRDFDPVRMRRNSRDSIHSSSSIADGPPPPVGHHPRGGLIRARGRGRGSYLDNRDTFRRRSRSREGRWDRDRERDRMVDRDRDWARDRDRDRERERDRDLDRRGADRRDRLDRWDEVDRRFDRDDRERQADYWESDRPPTGNDPRMPSTPSFPPPSTPLNAAISERISDRPHPSSIRKASVLETRRDSDRWEPPPSRPDAKDLPAPVKRSPPPSAPQVPAFGSVTAPLPGLPENASSEAAHPGSLPAKPDRQRPESPSLAPVKPPTGPKAGRYPPQPSSDPRLRRDDGLEPLSKQDLSFRVAKPPPGPAAHAAKPPLDVSPPTAPAAMASKEAPATHSETLRANNSGPVVTSPDLGTTPPAARPTSPSPHTSPGMQISGIPTGPRAHQHRPPPPRPSHKVTKPWARSNYGRAPSLPDSTANHRRESLDPKVRSLSASEQSRREAQLFYDERTKDPTFGDVSLMKAEGRTVPSLPPKEAVVRDPNPDGVAEEPALEGMEPRVTKEERENAMPDFSNASDEEEDERVVFTQDYLEERKQKFENDVKMLRASMPPSPLEDPNIVALLLRIQLLGMVANHAIPEGAAEVAAPEVEGKPLFETPATPFDYKSDNEPAAQNSPMNLDSKSPPRASTVTVESLPFLNSGPPTPISDLDVYQENAASFDRFKDVFCGELMRQRKESARKNAALRDEYMAYYKPWRLDVWEEDRLKGKDQDSPGPTTPPAPPLIPTPTSIAEGRRYKGNSELDFQNALRASEISAQEELERRRGNKATALPDLTREAVIPDMLEPQEVKGHIYKDSNNIVDTAKAMDVFGFLPPANDFTPEEHEKFTNAFMAHPKKWGKIAESLPGRDFQQCIVHYYLTKEEIKYKAKLNKRWSRRGRARRSIRPKSNALMADLGVVKPDYEGEEEPAPVTDTGRPRRAAAPTFGDSSAETDQAPSGRRGNTGRDGEQADKPAGKRGGRTGPGSRGGRRGRTAQQQQQLPTEQQLASIPSMPTTPLGKAEMEPSLDGAAEAAAARAKELSEREPSESLPRARAGRGRPRDGVYVFEPMEPEAAAPVRQAEMGYGSLQPTSYWSVPEQRDFRLLLAHFGRDFEGISNFMKTKTTVMVKNYFQRRIDSGQKDFEDIVSIAEGKKARGEPTGPLPVPSVAPKRRYEATPSAIVPRPLAPHTEAAPEVDEGRLAPKTKPTILSPQPAPLHVRPPSDRERNAPRYPPLAQASSPPMSTSLLLNEDPNRALRTHPSLPNRLSGPRLGYFTEERRELPPGYPAARPQESHIPSRQPVSPADAVRMETLRPSAADIHGSPLLTGQTTIPPSPQGYFPSQMPPSIMASSHSRQPSLTQAPGSPVQALHRLDPDAPSIRRDSIGQRQFYPLPGQPARTHQLSPLFPPAQEASRPGSTPAEPHEAARQVPAKRSNIMNILNDEPEEPQPRKRFASDQSSPVPRAASPSRSMYAGVSSLTQPTTQLRHAESQFSASQQRPSYAQQNQYLPPPRTYTDYQGHGSVPGGSGAPSNNDWMARFDPRGQPPPPQLSSRPSQPAYSPYATNQSHAGPSLATMPAPSPAPTPPPLSAQRPGYPTSLLGQALSSQTQGVAGGRQEAVLPQNPSYRQSIGSPRQRSGSISYGPRQEPPPPMESPTSLLSMGSRSSYAPPSQTTSGQPTYQQHVQTVVNGSHQQQAHRSSISIADGQYGRATPPPPAQAPRGLPGPSSLGLGRSYTPPAGLPPNASGGVAYAQGGPSASGMVPRPPGSLNEAAAGPPGHSRMYSQGSNTGPPPGHAPR